jgi:hypothetical protein
VADEVDDRDWRSKPVEALRGPLYRETAREPVREPVRQQPAREPQAAREPQQQQAAPQQAAPQQAAPQQAAPQQAAPQQQQQQQQQSRPGGGGGGGGGEAPKIVRAADMGREAYRPGAQVSGSDRALRQIKGILNKLTPEKFERLLEQLLQVGGGLARRRAAGRAAGRAAARAVAQLGASLGSATTGRQRPGRRAGGRHVGPAARRPSSCAPPAPQVVTTADILQKTIAMVFENAVAQPTFCAMYADLCLRLSRELPSFPPAGEPRGPGGRRAQPQRLAGAAVGAPAARQPPTRGPRLACCSPPAPRLTTPPTTPTPRPPQRARTSR